jgi:hypothetical protein
MFEVNHDDQQVTYIYTADEKKIDRMAQLTMGVFFGSQSCRIAKAKASNQYT